MNEQGDEPDEKRKQNHLPHRPENQRSTRRGEQTPQRPQKLFDRPVCPYRFSKTEWPPNGLVVIQMKIPKSDVQSVIPKQGDFYLYEITIATDDADARKINTQIQSLIKQLRSKKRGIRIIISS